MEFCYDWSIFYLDLGFWTVRHEHLKMFEMFSFKKKEKMIRSSWNLTIIIISRILTYTPKNEKIPKENVLPERARAKFQQIEIARAHSTGYSS